jgi:hypothetical protein
VYVAPSSSFNDAVTGTVIDPDAWNTLLADLETALNFGTTGATDNRLLRSDGTGGLTLQSSAITVDDSGNMSGVGTLSLTSISATTIDVGSTGTTLSEVSAGLLAVEGVTVALISTAQTLTNKTIALGANTISGTTAEFNTALSDNDFATLAGAETLSNKVLTLPQINDTSADHQYVFAVSELAADRTVTLPLLAGNDTFVFADFTQTLTNKTVNLTSNTLSGTIAQFNTALSDGDFATLAGSETLTNKTLTSPIITTSPTAAGATWTNLGTVTTADINGGTLDGTIIGGSSAAAGSFTTITASSNISITSSDPVISITDTDTSALNRISGNNATGSLYLFADIGAAVANSVILFNVDNADRVQVSSSATSPTSNDGNALGTTSLGWADLHGATGFTWNIANGDWLATHTTGILTVGTGDLRVTTAGTNTASVVTVGGTQTLTNKTLTSPVINAATFGTSVLPSSDGAVDLGSTTAAWNNLHLDTGATINIENGNWVFTHSSAIGTVSTGDLRVTTAGTNTASVVTVGGTQTLTAKTLTSPVIGTSPTAAGATWTDLGTVTTADINGGTLDGTVIGGASAAAITGTLITGQRFVPNSSTVPTNGLYLPAANTLGWAVNSAAEMQLTATALSPAADDGLALGTTALGWQSLFLDTGATINIENGDWLATHTAGILTVGTGDLRVTNAGTNTASAVTVAGTQTLTGKTLTTPVINGAVTTTGLTLPAFTLGGTVTSNGQSFSGTIANLGTVTTADINGGTLDGAVIGGASAAAGTFTNLTATGVVTITNGTSPTVDAAGEIAIDTDADGNFVDQGLIVYHDGAQKMFVIAVDTIPSSDNHALIYDAALDKFVFEAQTGGAGGGATTALDNLAGVAINTTLVSDTNNTDDLGTAAIAWRTGYLGTSLELGHASDTTLTRASAGVVAVEGKSLATVGVAAAMAIVFG